MVLLLRRATVRSAVLAAIALIMTGLAVAAWGADVEGTVVIGVSEPLWHYLQPYRRGFSEVYTRATVELVVVRDSVDDLACGGGSIHAWIIAEHEAGPGETPVGIGQAVVAESTAARPAATGVDGMVAAESFDLRFVPVVSAFNPTEEISLGVLRMALAGELGDWRRVQPGWSGQIQFLTWMYNPADSMIMHLFEDTDHYESNRVDLTSHDDLVNRLRLDPLGIAIAPLARIAPGVNPVSITAGHAAMHTQLVCRAQVFEPEQQSLLSRTRRWIAAHLGRRSVLDVFIAYVRQMDAVLSGSDAVTLVAVGDVMMDRGVRLAMNEHGMTHPFEGTHQILSAADIAVANLETPISNRGTPLNMFRAYPDVMKALRYSGIDVVSVANNHILDYDEIALSDTLEHLRANGILSTGAGFDLEQARRPASVEARAMTVAFLAYTELWFCQTKDNRRYDATETRAGVAPLRREVVEEGVARAASESDLVVVSCHWGEEYKHYPNETQRSLAQTAIDAGASIVLGHHPHVLQGLEFGDRWVIAYSLGNFVFDQRQPGTQDSLILRLTISAGYIIRVDLLPCYIVNCQPILLTGDAKRRALLEIHRLSAGIASTLTLPVASSR